jgi:pyrroline-5-carboxylate reductase
LIIAVLGGGRIGEAVARNLAKSRKVTRVIITKRDTSSIEKLESSKVRVTSDNMMATKKADVIIIAVKAGDAKQLLANIKKPAAGKLVISLMAAVSIKRLVSALPESRVLRTMPNIAAVIGQAITAYSPAPNLRKSDLETATFIMSCFGDCVEVPEDLMNAVTALSGSGPAYIALLIEALVSAGLMVGLPRELSLKLATKTLTGTANMLNEHGIHPAELRDSVTTPAGTTIAGIYQLEKGALRTSIMNAVEAATNAAEKVAKRFDDDQE